MLSSHRLAGLILAAVLSAFTVAPDAAQAQQRKPKPTPKKPAENTLNPELFKIGQQGKFALRNRGWFVVERVLGEKEMMVLAVQAGVTKGLIAQGSPFLLQGVPTKGLIDDRNVDLDGIYKVTDTKTMPNGKTVFVVELVPEPAAKPKP